MIPFYLIVLSALLTGAAVWVSASRSGSAAINALLAVVLAVILIVAWRLLANLWNLNEDFGPLVSVGDAGCLPAGALGPFLVGLLKHEFRLWWLPAAVGGLAAFLVNVVIL